MRHILCSLVSWNARNGSMSHRMEPESVIYRDDSYKTTKASSRISFSGPYCSPLWSTEVGDKTSTHSVPETAKPPPIDSPRAIHQGPRYDKPTRRLISSHYMTRTLFPRHFGQLWSRVGSKYIYPGLPPDLGLWSFLDSFHQEKFLYKFFKKSFDSDLLRSDLQASEPPSPNHNRASHNTQT
jgi:hypothetical protein